MINDSTNLCINSIIVFVIINKQMNRQFDTSVVCVLLTETRLIISTKDFFTHLHQIPSPNYVSLGTGVMDSR
jgi:hypothetical protein